MATAIVPNGVLSLFFAGACVSLVAAPATFYVSTNGLHEIAGVTWGTYRTDDGVDHDAYTDLQEALTCACEKNPGSTIWVEDGYVLDTGSTISDKVDSRLYYSGWDNKVTIRSRSGDWRTGAEIRGDATTRCVSAQGSVKMYGMRIVGGTATNGCGGGVYTHSHYGISLYNCLIADCRAQSSGGGAYASASDSVRLYDCVVTNCAAGAVGIGSGSGGGMSRGSVYNCWFDGCTAYGSKWDDGSGGGVCAAVNVSNCVFTSCMAFNSSQIDHASAQAGVGGAISGATTIRDCWITNCTATAAGGGVACSKEGANVTVVGCSAGRGGGGISGGTWTNVAIVGCVETNRKNSCSGGGAYKIVACDVLISNCVSYSVGGGADASVLTNATVVCNLATNTTEYGYPRGGGLNGCTAVRSLIAGNASICDVAQRGSAANGLGGGAQSSTLIACVVSNNVSWGRGGGVSGGRLANCVVAGNYSYSDGGGIAGAESVVGTLIVGNVAAKAQGGVFNYNTTMTMANCTVTCNTNGSVKQASVATPTAVTNCVVWGNTVPKDAAQLVAAAISHTCYPEAEDGTADGNVSADPRLRTRDGKAYSVTSQACRRRGVALDWMSKQDDASYLDWYEDIRRPDPSQEPDMGWVAIRQYGLLLLFR